MKSLSEARLMFECTCKVLAATGEEGYEQIKQEMTAAGKKAEFERIMSDGEALEDNYDMRRYALFEDENGNIIMLTCGCYEHDYANGRNLKKIEELCAYCDEGGLFHDDLLYLAEKSETIMVVYEWYNEYPQCETIEDSELYNLIVDTGYFGMITAIESAL